MIDGSLLATIAASAGIVAAGVGAAGVLAYLTLPREQDYFDLSMDELGSYTASGSSHPAAPAGSQGITVSHHRPDSGLPHGQLHDVVECETSPPPFIGSDRLFPSGSEADGAAVQPDNQGGPVFHSIEGSGESVPVQRDRPALFLVSK